MDNIYKITDRAFLSVLFILSGFSLYAQLPDFTVSATATPQTCLGNGSISLTVTGTDSSANIDYAVYLLPNTTTPVVVTTSATVNSLVSGNYLVIATQSLAGDSNTASVNVTIANNASVLQITPAIQNEHCGNDGSITINVNSGNPVSYEIIAGPVTAPLQPSNVFNNLPSGQYQVRTHDICGDAQVVTIQVVEAEPEVVILPTQLAGGELPGCGQIAVTHKFTATLGHEIFFPLTFEYTVFPPGGGAPQVVTQVVASGDAFGENTLNSVISFFNGEQYSYNIKVTDACGNVFTRNNNIINQELVFGITPDNDGCIDYVLVIDIDNYVGPYTVTFLDAPDGFVPEDFNASHPLFDISQIVYGDADNPLPEGFYNIQVTDACGSTVAYGITLMNDSEPVHLETIDPATCLGQVLIRLLDRAIATVVLTSAPVAYTEPLPQDVSDLYTPNIGFVMGGLPLGSYVFEVTDACGETYDVEIDILPPPAEFHIDQRPGCDPGMGTAMIWMEDDGIASAEITTAPPSFNQQLPYDISGSVAEGALYVSSLPGGYYVFDVTNACGISSPYAIMIEGYEEETDGVDIIPNCGSFDIDLHHSSNGDYIQSFWLQRFDAVTGTWGHPQTGMAYTDGSFPAVSNSVFLTNNTINFTMPYTGQFRILKVHHVYSSGSNDLTRCFSVIHEFTFEQAPEITEAYGFPCTDNLTEVIIEAVGVAPLTYSITQMNGAPFVVDNGTSNIFSGLSAATYNFRVTDACGNFRNVQLDINELDPIAIEAEALCDGQEGQLFVNQFSFLEYEWWEESNPEAILSTESSLPFSPFDSTADPGVYYVRVTSAGGSACEQILSYEVLPSSAANAGDDDTINYCNEGENLNLTAYLSEPHDAGGTWIDVNNSGALTGSTLNTAGLNEGVYEFRYFVSGMCDTTDEAIITFEINDIPQAPTAAPVASVCEGESIQLSVNNVQDAVYQWSGPDGFTSAEQNPFIENVSLVAAGDYEVIVLVNGCASPAAIVNVGVNALPDFTIEGNTTLCEEQTGTISVVPANFDGDMVTYQWYYDNTLLNGVNAQDVEVSEPGIYSVEVNNGNCLSLETLTVTENTDAFEIVLENGCLDFEYVISVVNSDEIGNASYSWVGPDGFNAVGEEIIITGAPAGTYSVEVIAADGCAATASLNIENTHCRIPRGISPGDFDLNNNFDLSNLDVRNLQIFNRYGLQVYERDNYKNEWYGQSDKGELPTGTYYYVVTLSAGKRVTGWVYLNRQVN